MMTASNFSYNTDLGVIYDNFKLPNISDYSNTFSQPQPASGGKGLSSLLNNLGSVTRLAGAVGDVVGMFQGTRGIEGVTRAIEESIPKIDTRSEQTLNQVKSLIDEIRGLTGKSTPDAVKEYEKRFGDYMIEAMDQARQDLATQPDLTRQYDTLETRIGDIRSSDLNLLNSPQFMAIAKRPQDYMSTTDVDAIKDVMTLGPEYRQHYSYADPETQGLIRGRPSAVQEYASFFANSPEVRGLMEYKV